MRRGGARDWRGDLMRGGLHGEDATSGGASRTRARGELKGGEEWKRLPLGLPRAGG